MIIRKSDFLKRYHGNYEVILKFYSLTDMGLVRTNNEDRIIVDENRGLFGIADGMGGHNAGEIASKIAAETILEFLRDKKTSEDGNLVLSLLAANQKIIDEARVDREKFGMGTTVTLASLSAGFLHYAHIGDSRMYLLRDGEIQQLTDDHTKVWELYKSGAISRAEADLHPLKNVLSKALGLKDSIEVDANKIEFRPSDIFILCSDGLTDMVKDSEIKGIVLESREDLKMAAENLIQRANGKGGIDNISIVLLSIEGRDMNRTNENKITNSISQDAPILNKILFYLIGFTFWTCLLFMPIYLLVYGCTYLVHFISSNKIFFSSSLSLVVLLFVASKYVTKNKSDYNRISGACEFFGFCLLILILLIMAASFLVGCFAPLVGNPVDIIRYFLLILLLFFLHYEGTIRSNLFNVH